MFVVYKETSGETIGVYNTERAAKTRASRNNNEWIMKLLDGSLDRRNFYNRMDKWAHCSYVEYAPHFYRWIKKKG